MNKNSLFIAATGKNIGKTTVCLGLVSGLLKKLNKVRQIAFRDELVKHSNLSYIFQTNNSLIFCYKDIFTEKLLSYHEENSEKLSSTEISLIHAPVLHVRSLGHCFSKCME